MAGMNNGLNVNDPIVVAAFRSALAHQLIIALLIFAVLSVAWVALREWAPAALRADLRTVAGAARPAEPVWRQLLRIGFGLLWIFDGILQAQPKMAVGLPSQVIEPTAASSPGWVQHLINWAGTAWSYHPIQAATATVWIQVGIGIWLLVAARGTLSRFAGLASVGWGLVVWVFGESFGGIFAPGLTWLFGAPGAVMIYCVAGALVALPERYWRTPRLGRLILAGTGLFLAGMAVLQAWPGRGFWQGTFRGQPGTLAGMAQQMATTPQPRFLSDLVSGFGSLTRAHGFAVNLFAVAALAAIGAAFLTGRRAVIRPAVIAFVALCLADWVLIEDFGFFGGLGTDPNSMIPMALLAAGGYHALTQAEAPAAASAGEAAAPAAAGPAAPAMSWRDRLRPAALHRSLVAASIGAVASAGAIGVIILGAVPMAAAQASPNADTILAQAIDGSTAPLDSPAPAFALTDQHGRQVTLASLRGKVILLTFLDPVCVTQCPLEAQEFKQASQMLGADTRRVELVAVNANPLYNELAYTQAFDRQERLDGVPGWLYLTGSPAQLRQVYSRYGVAVQTLPAGSMIGHSENTYVIDRSGHLREEMNFDPGPGTAATKSSFATQLTDAAEQALRSS
jgi:cytochrome oxidase Cu insertion factor (SCO1/SenC/PrrC family)